MLCYIPVTGQALKRLNHSSYNLNEGLLHSQVAGIAEDGNGFIWISSGNGVQRFDGKNFLQVPASNDDRGLPDDKHVSFFRLKNGNIWFTHSKGISEYEINTNRFRYIIRGETIDNNTSPVWEQNDGVWCRNPSGSLYLLDKKKLRFTDSISFSNQILHRDIITINSKMEDILFLGFTNTAIIISGKGWKKFRSFHPGKLQGKFIGLAAYKTDTLLIATQRGIEKMDIQSGNFVFVCPFKSTSAELATSLYIKLHGLYNGNYLVGEGREIYELNMQQAKYINRLVNLQNQDFLNVGFINKLYSDSHNNFWILSESDGISKVDYGPLGFRYYGTEYKRKNFVKTIYADKNDNRVLCGTAGSGLLVFDTLQQLLKTIDHFPEAIGPHTIGAIQKTAPHRYLLFVVGGWKVYLLNTQTFSLQQVRLDTGQIKMGFVFDYHMNILPSGDREGLLQNSYQIFHINWSEPGKVQIIASKDIPTASITSYRDPYKQLWVGGRWKYFLFKRDIESYKTFELPEKIIVRCFYADAAGRMWMGTEKGLFQLDKEGKIIKQFYKADGLIDENIYSVREDRKGNLWFSHNKGISCMKTNGAFTHFNKDDGLQENEFNTGAVAEAEDGELFFGGVNGVSSFFPEMLLQQYHRPALFITSIRIKEKEWITDTATWQINKIKLPWKDGSLSFQFTALGLRKPDQYTYQYRIRETDKTWINNGNNGTAKFVLSPGKYTLQFYAGNGFTMNAEPVKEISIVISPPYWKTNWFRGLVLFLIISASILITRYTARLKLKKRIEELERKKTLEEERLRISREMHDDIGAGLTRITMLSEAAKGKPQNEEQLNKIADTSRQLVADMSEIIWSMNPEHNTLDQLVAYLREQLRSLLEYSGINYKIDFPENGKEILLNNAQMRNLLLIIKELVHNAVKHSKASLVTIMLTHKVSSLDFVIADDGCGFDTSTSTHGNGMRNIKKRIEELSGKLNIQSSSSGTTVSGTVPL